MDMSTDVPRDPGEDSPENILPMPCTTFHLGFHAVTQATFTVFCRVTFYALVIICILAVVGVLVKCSGWFWRNKRICKERGDPRLARTSNSRSTARQSEGSQKRPTLEVKQRRPRPEVTNHHELKSKPESQDLFGQSGFRAVYDVTSSPAADPAFDYAPAIPRPPDRQPVPNSFKTPLPKSLRPQTYIKAESSTPSPESIVTHTPQKPQQIVPGDLVLRIRPPQTILKGTSDETDLYDGPWEVLKVEEKQKVQHTPMFRRTPKKIGKLANSSKTCAQLGIPADSLLHKLSQGWVELAYLVKVDSAFKLAVTEGSRSSTIGEDGEKYYLIEKVRGVKHEFPKPRQTSSNSRAATVSPGNTATVLITKKYLVHWVGYPSEDNTWELAEKDQAGGVPELFIREWRHREKAWKEAREAELVQKYYSNL